MLATTDLLELPLVQVSQLIIASEELTSRDHQVVLLVAKKERILTPSSVAHLGLQEWLLPVEMTRACSTRVVLPPSAVETHPGETLVRAQLLAVQAMARVLDSVPATPTVATAVATIALDSVATEKIEATVAASVVDVTATEAALAATVAASVADVTAKEAASAAATVVVVAAASAVVTVVVATAKEVASVADATVREVAVVAVPLVAQIIMEVDSEDSEVQTLAESDHI